MNTITFTKNNQEFKVSYKGGTLFTVETSNLYKVGDYEYDEEDTISQKVNAGYKDGNLKFHSAYVLVAGNKFGGVKIDDQLAIDQIELMIKTNAESRENDKNDRESNRPVGYPSYDNIVIYNVGCDTGLIYSEEKRPIIKLAIERGAKVTPLLRGTRGDDNKYPGQMDSHIPYNLATEINGKLSVPGYSHVYEDIYFISKEDFDSAKLIIDTKNDTEKKESDGVISAAFKIAKETSKPVLLSKFVVAEEDSPLAADGEGDMVDVCTFAMPDGTTEQKYFHNY